MEKKLFALTTLLLLVSLAFASNNYSSQVEVSQAIEVKVGFLNPLTGGLAPFSKGFTQSAELAIKQLNADDSYSAYNFKLTQYDTETSPDGASQAAIAAVDAGSHYLVGPATSGSTILAGAVAKSNGTPLISYASTSPEITSLDDDNFVFRVVPSDAFQGKAIADYAIENGLKKAVTIYRDDAWGIGVSDAFSAAFLEGNGTSVTKKLAYPTTTVEFDSFVTQLVAQSPDLIVGASFTDDGAPLFDALAEANVTAQIYIADGAADNSVYESLNNPDALTDVIAFRPSADLETAESVQFYENYTAEYGANALNGAIYTAEVYDAVFAGAMAVKNAGGVSNKTKIAEEIEKLEWTGASGPKDFDSNGDIAIARYQILKGGATAFTEIGFVVIVDTTNTNPINTNTTITDPTNTNTTITDPTNTNTTITDPTNTNSPRIPVNLLIMFLGILSASILIAIKRKIKK